MWHTASSVCGGGAGTAAQELDEDGVAYHHWDYLTLACAPDEAHLMSMRVQKPDLRTPGPSMYSFCLTTPSVGAVAFLGSEVESVEAVCRANPAHAPRLRTKQTMQSVAGTIRTAKRRECLRARLACAGVEILRNRWCVRAVSAFRRRVADKARARAQTAQSASAEGVQGSATAGTEAHEAAASSS